MNNRRFDPSTVEQIKVLASNIADPTGLQAFAQNVLGQLPSEAHGEALGMIADANPFFEPTPAQAPDAPAFDYDAFSQSMLQARIAATQSTAPRILLACPPKSASTFLSEVLADALGLAKKSVSCPAHTPLSTSILGANLREQEVDDLALLKRCLDDDGFVAQHHVRCSPYLCGQIGLYGMRVVITTRNIFDSLISLDDMHLESRKTADPEVAFLNDGLPPRYAELPFEQRLEFLFDRAFCWYLQFYVSWRKCEDQFGVRPLWISYEEDIKGDPSALAEKLERGLDRPDLDMPGLDAATLEAQIKGLRGDAKTRMNKGVSGRGAAVPDHLRARAKNLIEMFADETDLSPLIEPAPAEAQPAAA